MTLFVNSSSLGATLNVSFTKKIRVLAGLDVLAAAVSVPAARAGISHSDPDRGGG
jgi:hypothetical protein